MQCPRMLPYVPDDSAGDSVKGSMTLTECPELLKSRDGSMKGFIVKSKNFAKQRFPERALARFLVFRVLIKRKRPASAGLGFVMMSRFTLPIQTPCGKSQIHQKASQKSVRHLCF